jgi:hypothetical protein
MLATLKAVTDIGLGLTPWVPWDGQYGLDSIIAEDLTVALGVTRGSDHRPTGDDARQVLQVAPV